MSFFSYIFHYFVFFFYILGDFPTSVQYISSPTSDAFHSIIQSIVTVSWPSYFLSRSWIDLSWGQFVLVCKDAILSVF